MCSKTHASQHFLHFHFEPVRCFCTRSMSVPIYYLPYGLQTFINLFKWLSDWKTLVAILMMRSNKLQTRHI
jgi:hypothetical protein